LTFIKYDGVTMVTVLDCWCYFYSLL